jgi:hypothetical protein
MALVQTFGINATKRSGTLRGSCGENSIPDFGRPVVLDAKHSEFELTFPDSVHQFNGIVKLFDVSTAGSRIGVETA